MREPAEPPGPPDWMGVTRAPPPGHPQRSGLRGEKVRGLVPAAVPAATLEQNPAVSPPPSPPSHACLP